MASGRRPHGRAPHRNPGRVTRLAGRVLAAEYRGAGFWRRSHDSKVPFDTFCAALLQERRARRTIRRDDGRFPEPRQVYPCHYGDHYLIETAPRHWHIGRPSC